MTISVGIAAYNEEENISKLIDSLLTQRYQTATLLELIVVSDGSTDATDSLVQSSTDSRVRLIRLAQRSGQNMAQNKIHTEAKGDVLVVLDADMLPSDEYFIEKMIAPILSEQADLVGVQLLPSNPNSFFEKMLAEIQHFKVHLYERIRSGKSIYMCFGPARSFSKRLYTTLQYPDNCPTDAYSYLYAKREGYVFAAVSKPPALFRVPSTFNDHMRQSSRFASGKKTLEEIFGEDVVHKEFSIPKGLLGLFSIKELFSHPVYFSTFILSNVYIRVAKRRDSFTSRWEIATTTKSI